MNKNNIKICSLFAIISIIIICFLNQIQPTTDTVLIGTCNIELHHESYELSLILEDYEYFYDESQGPFMGENWIGNGILILSNKTNNIKVSSYSIGKVHFNEKFEITVSDHNKDGIYEFLIGQYSSSNNNSYRMYFIDHNLDIGYYDMLGELLMCSHLMSPAIKDDFTYEYYDNSDGKFIEDTIDVHLIRIENLEETNEVTVLE